MECRSQEVEKSEESAGCSSGATNKCIVPKLHTLNLSPDGVTENFALPTSFHGKQMQISSGTVIDVDMDNYTKLKLWLKEFSENNFVAWRDAWRSQKKVTDVFKYKCLHANFGQKVIKTTNTQCPVELIAKIVKQPAKNSPPCRIEIGGQHNHSLDSAAALRELRRSTVTTDAFEEYFRQGMLPMQAARFHQLRRGLTNDVSMSADSRVNPSRFSLAKLRQHWLQDQHGSFDKESIAAAVERYKEENPQHIIACDATDGDESFAIALVTDFMQRVHSSVRAAGEVVFIGTTSHVDQSNAALTLIVCASPAGALPLGVIITSGQSKEDYKKGVQLLQRQLGQRAFYGAGYPQCIITDDSAAERGALAEVWPDSRLFLCVFHVLQAAWRWLWNAKNNVQLQQRKPLILTLKKLVYAANKEEFGHIWDDYKNSSLAAGNARATQPFETLVARKKLWSLPWRAGYLLRGHHTNNYCESMMMVVKDIVINRNKVYNPTALLVVMAEVYSGHLKQRFLDFDVKKSSAQNNASTIPLTAISQTEEAEKCTFEVQSSTAEGVYKVDLTIGVCTCPDGSTGRAYKHQVACSQYSTLRLPQNFCNCPSQRRYLAVVAVGEEKVPADDFFKDFQTTETKCDCISAHGNGPPKAADMVQVVSTQDPVPPEVNVNDSPQQDTSKETSSERDSTLELLKNTLVLLDSPEVRKGLQCFKLRFGKIKTKSQLATFLHTAGSTMFNKRSLGRKIVCQPTSVARRKAGISRGKAALMRGGDISTKRKRCLTKNFNENKPNAKIN